MRPNEEKAAVPTNRHAQHVDLWQLLSESPIFKVIFRIQSQSCTLKVALEAEYASEHMPALSSMAGIIQEESEEFTSLLTDWLLDRGVTIESLQSAA